MFLGARITQLREAKGWTAGKLASESGVSRAYLWQLETGGKDKPSIDVLEKLAAALGVNVSEFSDSEAPGDDTAPAHPEGLKRFIEERGKQLGVTKGDIEVMRRIHFRGQQPGRPEDWELMFLFLQKWARE